MDNKIPMTKETLLIRADASIAIGTGHVMRCLALAQAWQDAGGKAVFAAAEMPSGIEHRLEIEGFSIVRMQGLGGGVEDAGRTVELVRQNGATWLVVDGDRFDVAFLEKIQSGGARVLLIDDYAQRKSFPAELILNPNLDTREESYRIAGASCRLLLGESYIMLRREFTGGREERMFPELGGRVLVTLGGSDPENLTPQIVEALGRLPGSEITVIAGPAYRFVTELERTRSHNVHVVFDAENMPKWMAHADMAVIAGGGTLWELLYVGCAVLSYARNRAQGRLVEKLEMKGALRNMGATADFDGVALATAVEELGRSKKVREQMGNTGRQLIDGKGATRVLQAMQESAAGG